YKMDYGEIIAAHVASGADITVGCVQVPREKARAFGVMTADPSGRVLRFSEKPEQPEPMPSDPDRALVSMGIYVFTREALLQKLRGDSEDLDPARDSGRDVIAAAIADGKVMAFPFSDPRSGRQAYWRDVGTVDAFYAANQELIGDNPELNLYDEEWP